MTISLSIHFLEGYDLCEGLRALPVALGIHATSPVIISTTISVTELCLSEQDDNPIGQIFSEGAWFPSTEPLRLTPTRSTFIVRDLMEREERVLPPGRFTLSARVLVFVATSEDDELDRDDFRRHEIRVTREVEIPQSDR